MRVNSAFIRYITNDGSGASIAAPGRASAWVTIAMISSEPLPMSSPDSAGIEKTSRRRAFSSGASGSG